MSEQTPLSIYMAFFGITPTIFQQEIMADAVTDMKVWRDACTYWAGNDYRPQSVQKLCDYYKQLVGKKPTFSYGKPTATVGKSYAEVTEKWNCPDCHDTGKKWITNPDPQPGEMSVKEIRCPKGCEEKVAA